MTLRPSGPSHTPTLNGVPFGVASGEPSPPTCAFEPHVSFCVEKPRMPACASSDGSEAGKPKQSGSMYSSLAMPSRSEEHTSELQSQSNLVCRLLLEKKNSS